MATTSGRRDAEPRSGGKIVRNRRPPALSRTPYSRPTKPLERDSIEEQPGNPSWLSGLIYPAKMIASGAGKIISFFGNDSSSSSGADNSENDDDDDDEVENDVSFQGDDRSNKVIFPSSKSDNKRKIEQLVMQETFLREEGNNLIKLVKSRVVDTSDESTPNMRTTAIMEARKWLQEKRSGSKRKLENELDVTNLATPSQVTGSEKGSPVDMAKSFMQNRPAWASPSLKHIEFESPSPLGVQHFKEETPQSIFRRSELKRSSLSSGSWNILEEIRRVRSRAKEELLAAKPLTKIGLSSFSLENNPPQDSVINNRDERTAPAEPIHDRAQNLLLDAAASLPTRLDQDGDAVQSMEHQKCEEATDLKSNKNDEVNELRSTAAENGFASSTSGLFAEQDATQKPSPSEDENAIPIGTSRGRPDVHIDENPNIQPEPVIDIPVAIPTDSVVNGSQNSSSMHQEELSQELSQPTRSRAPIPKAFGRQTEKKSRGYGQRGRARRK